MSAPSKPESSGRSGRIGRLRSDSRGAVFVEFLIAFLPVYVFFLCVIQLGLLFVVRLVVEHAAVNGARALAVVAGDDPKTYGGFEKELNRVNRNGRREEAVRNAVVLTLAPLILNGVVQSADVIVVLHDGEIVEVGTHRELLHRHGPYRGLLSAQLGRSETSLHHGAQDAL